MQLEWEITKNKEFDNKIVELVGSHILAQILANRGIDTLEKARVFLNPKSYPISSYKNFNDIPKAVDRIKEAIEKGQNIVICGDFDCDGVTSSAILYKTLVKIGAKVGCYIPNRKNESHGLNSKAIIEIISKQRAKLIITVDNGISNISEIKLAKSLGTDIIVTDHHEPPEILPDAYAIINPKCSEKISTALDFAQIENMVNFAGVMVAYKLCCALLDEFGQTDFKNELLPYVMIGTISDVMPLMNENRSIVTLGLEQLRLKTPLWAQKLFELANRSLEHIESETIAFTVAPRINAAGRLEQATTALELLVSDDVEKINFCANQLNQFNQTRQQMCDTSFFEAVSKIKAEINLKKTKAIVLADEKWHIGIIGLLASRLVELYNKPAFILTIDKEENKARCSIRGLKGLNIHKVLIDIADYLENYGGHELAGGFSVDLNKISIENLSSKINFAVSQQLQTGELKRTMPVDYVLLPDELTVDLIEKISVLEPFGEGNSSPIFGIRDLVLKKIDVIGNNASHLKMLFEAEDKSAVFEGLIWNKNSHPVQLLDKVDLTFVPQINEFRGNKTIQLVIKNIFIKNRQIDKAVDFSEADDVAQAVLVDHRKKTDFLKMLNSYLSNKEALIFCENRDIICQLQNYPAINKCVKNRFELSPSSELIFLSTPCCEDEFKLILQKTEAQKVHIFNSLEKKIEVNEFIKTISGMLKYCAKHTNGKIEIEKSLAYLAVTQEIFDLCIRLLEKAHIIKILLKQDISYEFEFIEACQLSTLLNFEEYELLCDEIEKINSFKEEFQSCNIAQIKEMLEN